MDTLRPPKRLPGSCERRSPGRRAMRLWPWAPAFAGALALAVPAYFSAAQASAMRLQASVRMSSEVA